MSKEGTLCRCDRCARLRRSLLNSATLRQDYFTGQGYAAEQLSALRFVESSFTSFNLLSRMEAVFHTRVASHTSGPSWRQKEILKYVRTHEYRPLRKLSSDQEQEHSDGRMANSMNSAMRQNE